VDVDVNENVNMAVNMDVNMNVMNSNRPTRMSNANERALRGVIFDFDFHSDSDAMRVLLGPETQ